MSAFAISPADRDAINRAHDRRFAMGELGRTISWRGGDGLSGMWASTDIEWGSQILVMLRPGKRLLVTESRATWWDEFNPDWDNFEEDPEPDLELTEADIALADIAPPEGMGFAAKFLLAVAIAVFIGTCTLIYVDRERIMSAIAASEEVV